MHLINLHQSLQTKIYQDLLNSETIQGMDYTSFITNTNETTSFILLKELYRISSIKQKKLKNIQLENVEKLFLGIVNQMDKWSTNDIIELLSDSNKNKSDFQNSLYLKTIIYLCDKYPEIIKFNINTISTKVSGLLHSFKKNILALAEICCEKLLSSCGNKDLNPFIPDVIKTIKNSKYTDEAIEKLAGCIFVQNVELPALSVTAPILRRGLRGRTSELRRKSCVIIDNMCKLIEHPKEIIPLLPELEPLILECTINISNPEAREVSIKCYNTVQKLKKIKFTLKLFTNDEIKDIIIKSYQEKSVEILNNVQLDLVSKKINYMIKADHFVKDDWFIIMKKYINTPEELLQNIFDKLGKVNEIVEDRYIDEEEGVDLYKGEFSLAYGALTLLNNTFLHLKKNRFYGLLGPNNCGKTTLMRAIANEQVDGFPKRDELKTVFVEHEIEEREVGEDDKGYPIFNIDLCGIDWVVDCCNNVYHMEPPVKRDSVEEVMQKIGFGNCKKYPGMERAADAEMGVTTYSGGWKMKMQLCAATLMNADILMLDEPTGHLDVDNIQWIKDFLSDFRNNGGSIICTSHDSAFLNEMCTHIIDFQNRKLVTFREPGDNLLEKFVAKYPEKKGYFELKNDVIKFEFPIPGPLNSKKGTKSILKMNNVTFQYPIRDKPTVFDISLTCSLSSRVAVIGPNGAGKSTAIKLLIGQLKASEGTIWRNNTARIAYVAQHAFQHLEKHITKTPSQYLLWRFAGNVDKENEDFKADKDEEVVNSKYYLHKIELGYELRVARTSEQLRKQVTLKKILTRRENKKAKTREYEITLIDQPKDLTVYVELKVLENMGKIAEVNRFEEKLAAQQGMMNRSLTLKNVEKHLTGFGIEPEQSSHTRISSLSGGQKVKVVLAASMWMCPHLLILDEPTNYLDRDGLGALTKAIEEFKGGVVIISHNREFANAVASERWIMEKGRLRKEGESVANIDENKITKDITPDTVKDAFGNVIKVDKKHQMTVKEIKKEIKSLMKEKKIFKKKGASDEVFDLEIKIEELQEKMEELKKEDN